MSTSSLSRRRQAHTAKRTEAAPPPAQPPLPAAPRRIDGSDIVREMRRRDSRKIETAVLFFHPNIVTRPESVSFPATADNSVRRFLENRCQLFETLRHQLDETWNRVDEEQQQQQHCVLDMADDSSSSIATTDALIQHMLACNHPYCLERPAIASSPIRQFLYEPLLKLFYDDDHHHVLAVFPKLYRTLHTHHFCSLTAIQPLRERLCHWMDLMMGDFHGAESDYKQKILPVLKPGGLPPIPSLAQLASAGLAICVQDPTEHMPGDGGIRVVVDDSSSEVRLRRISLYDLRYSYSNFRQNAIPHTENAYELAFSTCMVKLARLIPDEPSFQLACRHGILADTELAVDFQWWRDNVLCNAEYYERESPYFWPIQQLRTILDRLNDVYASKTATASSLLTRSLHGIDKEAVLFFHPTASTRRDALSISTLETCAAKQRCTPLELLCYQRRHDLAEIYDRLDQATRDVRGNSPQPVSVPDLIEYAEGNSTHLNEQFQQCTFPVQPFMQLLYTTPDRALYILESIGRRRRMQQLGAEKEPAHGAYAQTIFQSLVGDFFGTVPSDYAFDFGASDMTHGSSTYRTDLYALASPADHVPSLHQLANEGGFTIMACDGLLDGGIEVHDGTTLRIKRVSLLDIRFTEHSFSSPSSDPTRSSLEGYFADAMTKLASLVPDQISFTLATSLGILGETLFIDWLWWEAHVVRLGKYYAQQEWYTMGERTYRVLQDVKRAWMGRKQTLAGQWPLQAALDALDARSKLVVRFFHPTPADICIPSSTASATATDPVQHARILFEQRQMDLHDLLYTVDANGRFWNNSGSDSDHEFACVIDHASCADATHLDPSTINPHGDWKRYDIAPLLLLFLDRAPFSHLYRIRCGLDRSSASPANLHHFDCIIRTLAGTLYSTLPDDWITAQKHQKHITDVSPQRMPSLDDWARAGFRIQSEPRVEPHGMVINKARETLCVQTVSLLDIRYGIQHFQKLDGEMQKNNGINNVGCPDDMFEGCFADCMLKLSALVPDPRSFAVALDTGMIPASLMIDWPWWRCHILSAAQHYGHHPRRPSTQELFGIMEKEYTRHMHPTTPQKWIRYARRYPRHILCAVLLAILAILVLLQTVRGFHA